MKKILLSVILLALLAPAAFSLDPSGFRFGLKASPSIAWMRPEISNYTSDGLRIGFAYGFVGDIRLGDFYDFSTGISINMVGGKLVYPYQLSVTEQVNLSRTYKLNYLEIPLTIKMHTQEIGYLTYYGRFGFGFGVNLRSRASDSYESSGDQITIEREDIKSETRLLRGSLIVGLGVEYSLGGRTALVGGLTFNNGFTNVLKGTNDVIGRKPSAINNFLELTFGIMF
ncbi:MAG: porin family protein [Bacteroides sp.]|jgi:hypothetical protein|nr:porin family protein [Bacteroides sp.]